MNLCNKCQNPRKLIRILKDSKDNSRAGLRERETEVDWKTRLSNVKKWKETKKDVNNIWRTKQRRTHCKQRWTSGGSMPTTKEDSAGRPRGVEATYGTRRVWGADSAHSRRGQACQAVGHRFVMHG